MHWILTVSESFALDKVLARSERLLCPPFSVGAKESTLYRVERLSTGHTVELTISQTSTGLVIRTDARLDSKETEEISQKVWRMLRIGENLQAFLDKARTTPQLAAAAREGALQLRGATMFEDIVKAAVLIFNPEKNYVPSVSWLVDRFGDPLPSNPTLNAFPTPRQLLGEMALQEKILGTRLARGIHKITTLFQAQKTKSEGWFAPHLTLTAFEINLRQILDLGNEDIGRAMLYLGRYDYIPVDYHAQQRVGLYLGEQAQATPEKVRALFQNWQPWGGLAYWLWDWSTSGAVMPPKSEESYGALENWRRTG